MVESESVARHISDVVAGLDQEFILGVGFDRLHATGGEECDGTKQYAEGDELGHKSGRG